MSTVATMFQIQATFIEFHQKNKEITAAELQDERGVDKGIGGQGDKEKGGICKGTIVSKFSNTEIIG